MNQSDPRFTDRILPCLGSTAVLDRPQARVIIPCWGEQYVAELLAVTLPALGAPRNLVAFSNSFACELVLVTETRFFDSIAVHPVIAQLRGCCSIRLRAIDDLISQWYGITLTYALVRGFADLGSVMTETHLLFFNVDFIVADGSLERLTEEIRNGARLVCAPSYCVIREEAADKLLLFFDQTHMRLTIPHREMARIIIDHRHNTIRAKTINQRLFRLHRYDQFYWYVDAQTLVGRQLPVAIVYMRPVAAVTEMTTFWDYGAESTYCPGIAPQVLGDSDDFLMAELRAEGTFTDLLHLGSASPEEIATDWSTFIVQDHLDFCDRPLLVHAGERPPQVSFADAQLSAFIAAIRAKLPAPVSNRNHPFWAQSIALFLAARGENLARMASASPGAESSTQAPGHLSRAIQLYRGLFGQLPYTTTWHPFDASLYHARAAFSAAAARAKRILLIADNDSIGASLARGCTAETVILTPLSAHRRLREAAAFGDRFDVCFCQLDFDDFCQFAALSEGLRSLLAPQATLILFHHNLLLRHLDEWVPLLAKRCFPRFGSSALSLTGSWPSAIATRWFRQTLRRAQLGSLRGKAKLAFVLAICAPLARLGSAIERRRRPGTVPRACTSITIVIENEGDCRPPTERGQAATI